MPSSSMRASSVGEGGAPPVAILETPNVYVEAPSVSVQPPSVTVQVPEAKGLKIERDRMGRITGAKPEE